MSPWERTKRKLAVATAHTSQHLLRGLDHRPGQHRDSTFSPRRTKCISKKRPGIAFRFYHALLNGPLPAADILSFQGTGCPPVNCLMRPKTMQRTVMLLNFLFFQIFYSFACALANKLLPAPLTAEDDTKETPIIFIIRRWRMGAFHKMCIALGSVCFLLGCAAHLQESTQIQCTGSGGQILYAGPYIEESLTEYLVQVDDWTQAVVRKDVCRKVQA
jgi:hypothetical protein